MYKHQLNLPEPANLSNDPNDPQPFVFIGDEAFALHTNLLRPFPSRGLTLTKKVFNYRLSRARRLVEFVFGVLANKWRVLHTLIEVKPEFTDIVVKACCVLHNFVRKRDGYNVEGMETNTLNDIEPYGTDARTLGTNFREYFANYFLGPMVDRRTIK